MRRTPPQSVINLIIVSVDWRDSYPISYAIGSFLLPPSSFIPSSSFFLLFQVLVPSAHSGQGHHTRPPSP